MDVSYIHETINTTIFSCSENYCQAWRSCIRAQSLAPLGVWEGSLELVTFKMGLEGENGSYCGERGWWLEHCKKKHAKIRWVFLIKDSTKFQCGFLPMEQQESKELSRRLDYAGLVQWKDLEPVWRAMLAYFLKKESMKGPVWCSKVEMPSGE